MNLRLRFLLVALLAAFSAATASARLGETLADLKKHFGAPVQQMQPRKDQATWLFEGEDGQLMYSVTFNAKGQSIAEGLKPLKVARFDRNTAMDFVDSARAPFRDSKTMRVVKPGEVYQYAGKAYSCGAKEYVVLDEPNGLLIIWSQAGIPSVMVLAPEMMAQMF
jgi:hypothetical protein